MEILVIGNGFDLAHKLPTQYIDFLEFCKKTKGVYIESKNASVYQQEYLDNQDMDEMFKSILREAFDNRKCKTNLLDNGVIEIEASTPQ